MHEMKIKVPDWILLVLMIVKPFHTTFLQPCDTEISIKVKFSRACCRKVRLKVIYQTLLIERKVKRNILNTVLTAVNILSNEISRVVHDLCSNDKFSSFINNEAESNFKYHVS